MTPGVQVRSYLAQWQAESLPRIHATEALREA